MSLHRRIQAYDDPPGYAAGAVGKLNLNEYKQRGYLASTVAESVSRTLDYGFADFSTAQAFIVLSDHPHVAGEANPKEKAELRRQAEELLVRFVETSPLVYSLIPPPHDTLHTA